LHLSHNQAINLMLAAQGLLVRPSRIATKADVLDTIRQMQILQIDTINVVARSPYLVLWSRLGDYEQRWLEDLHAEGALFEFWSHEACFVPVEDYPIYRRFMLEPDSFPRTRKWIENHQDEVQQMLAHIRENGEVRSTDFVRTDGQKGGWWNRKPEKEALDRLHIYGELMIVRRHNFQRIYDLRERVLPSWDDASAPSLDEVRRTLVLKAVRALGVTTANWVADYFRTKKTETNHLPAILAEVGQLIKVKVEGWNTPGFIHPDNLALAEAAAANALKPELTTLLSPFDPLVWDRARALAMFNFEYRIECYTPAPKRRYGYFTLPILHKGKRIGRLDPKAHRQQGRFEIKALHLEPGVAVTEELLDDLAGALQECAAWHKTPEVIIQQSDPPEVVALLQRRLEARVS